MRAIRDEQAYFLVLGDFVAGRVSAALFVPRFRHLWQCGGGDDIVIARAKVDISAKDGGLYGLLEGIHILCETYAHNLPDGRGYRVSEEQFRKEVQSRTSALPLRSAPRVFAAPTGMPGG
jgi:hypothetical protein